MDWDELTRLGLYDPNAPDAEQKRELLEYLAAQGATIEEMLIAEREHRLPFVLGDRLINPGRPELTLEETARRVGVDVTIITRCWRALGFPASDLGGPAFAEADVRAVQLLAIALDAFGEAGTVQMARVIGSSLARIAEAGFAVSLANVEDGFLPRAESLVAAARAAEGLGMMAQAAPTVFDVVFRHHLEVVARRWDLTPSDNPEQVELAVGFADLTGFTDVARTLRAADLSAALLDLETIASDAATARSGRLVKLIGDEVMFIAPDANAGCEVALAVLDAVDRHPVLPALRAGLSFGVVVPHEGDYFGSPVNLAARLTDVSRAGEVLVSEEVVGALDRRRFTTTPLAPISLKGYASPVPAAAVRPAATAAS
jgi:class 3 adenylate cyclase